MTAHQLLEGAQRASELLVGSGPAGQIVPTIQITDREWIAALAVAQQEPALEVYSPNMIGIPRLRERSSRDITPAIVLTAGGRRIP